VARDMKYIAVGILQYLSHVAHSFVLSLVARPLRPSVLPKGNAGTMDPIAPIGYFLDE
jgi:hypothetical protein